MAIIGDSLRARLIETVGPYYSGIAQEDAPDSFGSKFLVEDSAFNPIYTTTRTDMILKELHQFFPMQQTLAVIKPDQQASKGLIFMIAAVFLCVD